MSSQSAARLRVFLPGQMLEAQNAEGKILARYQISTAANGAGERMGSEQTPRGLHVVRARIGAGLPLYSVFVARRPTGELWTPELAAAHPGRDWILTRILWLSGCEAGFNRLGRVDSMRRYIYIHGSGEDVTLGTPRSHGCIRLGCRDMRELFDRTQAGCPVEIIG
ncbi:MAG: L,D-transpeptidase [Zoogloeaceae bacterium]|jgi:lipoprotein-anchoring transpeptidase ErfK/SrfK|nr:L,D-transpeptidase [Zoogloeaceae bacterium]